MKYLILKTILTTQLLVMQTKVQSQQIDSIGKFEKLVFHSSRCYGLCPELNFQIDRKGTMLLNRQFYLRKSDSDTSKSGNFKGLLSVKRFNKFLSVVNSTNYEGLHVREVLCCDAPIITLIVYYAGKRYYFKSMEYAESVEYLISYLKQLAIDIILPKYQGEVQIEN